MAQNRLRDCLNARVSAGVFSKEKADMLEALATDLEREYREQMAPELAGQAAAAEAVRIMREAAEANKRRTALQIMAQTRALDDAATHPDGVVAGGMALLVRDMRGKATFSNVEARKEVVLGQLFRRAEQGLNAFRSKAAGLVQNTAGMRNVVKELFGEATNDAEAKGFSKGFTDASDYAADRFIAAGGDLTKREDWRLPQVHDAQRIRKAGFEGWRDTIMPLLDDRTWSRLESMRQELIGERRTVEDAIATATKQRDELKAKAGASRQQFESVSGTATSAERRIRDLDRQLAEVNRELEAQRARAMEHQLNARERRLNEVERTAADADALLPDQQDAAAAARRGDAKAGRDRVRAGEADTAISRLESRRADLERQLDAQRVRRADAEEAVKGKSGHWQAYEEDLRRLEQTISDLEKNRRIIKDRITAEPGAINAAHREEVLRYIFDQMTSEVPASLKPGTMAASRHNARRFFEFKDADSWLAYNDKFGAGQGGLYDVLVGHMEGMARDIALTEILGPKHGATVRALQEAAYKAEGARDMGVLARLNPVRSVESAAAIGRTYDVLSGRLGAAQSELTAAIFGGIRNWMTASKLGSALVSAVPADSVMATWAAKANGVPAVKLLGSVLKQLNPASEADRAFALRMGIVSSAVMDSAIGSKRFADEIVGQGITGRMASFVVRAQGLSAWTNGMKNAFMLEMMGHVADNAGKPLGEVDAPLRKMLERYGFSATDWDVIRAAPQMEHEGARFFDPANVSDRQLGERLMEAIIEERAFAVLEPDARVRQLTTGGLQRGTFMGEMARSAMLFKSFSITMATTHLARAFIDANGSKVAQLAALSTMLTLAGAVSIQARQIITGKDPRRMDDPKFWGAAWMQGGGAGIFGDFFAAGLDRGQQGLPMTLAGPVFGLADQAARLAIPDYRKVLEGEPTKFGAEVARFVRYNLPGANLWYSRLVTDRAVMDTIQSMVDPDYRQSFRRMEDRARKDYGQRFWWRPGQAPDRAPDLEAALPR
ncbi:hypothetical protein [Azospirillum argentinense]|uniref:hypothetical protein n=1 Tax=Azospirillum argentinense TaxID=2970906 RepID=UPI0032E03280